MKFLFLVLKIVLPKTEDKDLIAKFYRNMTTKRPISLI